MSDSLKYCKDIGKVDDDDYNRGNSGFLQTLESCSVKNQLCLFPLCDQGDC